MTKWRHDELQHDLATHLRAAQDRIVWENMQLGPSGSARPDCYTMQKSYSKPAPMAYEIKVSVSDFRSDVTSGKWQAYLDFACGVFFAVPEGLIRLEDVPPGCGLIVRHDKIWRATRKPTLKAMPTLSRDVWMKLVIDGVHRAHADMRRHAASTWAQEAAIRRKLGDEAADVLHDLRRARERKESYERDAELAKAQAAESREQAAKQVETMRAEAAAEIRQALAIPDSVTDRQLLWRTRELIQDRLKAFEVDPVLKATAQALRKAHREIEQTLSMLPGQTADEAAVAT